MIKYKLLHQFIKDQFVSGTVTIEDLPDETIKVTDKKGDSIVLGIDLETKEIRDTDGILRGNL